MQVLSIKQNGKWTDLAVSQSRRLILDLYKNLMKEFHNNGQRVAIKIEKRS